MQWTMSDEEKLLKISEFLKKTKVNKKILSDCCIICLDSFENCTSLTYTIINESQRGKRQKNNNDILIDIENETNINSNINTYSMEFKEQMELQNLISNNNINNFNNINNENNIYNIYSQNNNNINNENNNNIINFSVFS